MAYKKITKEIRIVGDIAEVTLTQGKVAIIDAGDVELVRPYTWHTYKANNGSYYVRTSFKGEQIRMHRLILNAKSPAVDHIDGDGLNNRRNNIRECTFSENSRNIKSSGKNTTGFKGVTFVKLKNRYKAMICVEGKHIYLGTYREPIDAGKAYDVACLKYHGEFAKPNFSSL